MPRTVILTNESGDDLGTAGLLEAHTGEGKLHLAFSVFVFDPTRNLTLIQRRSRVKMLWPLIWANTCCSHPNKNEDPVSAGRRRLQEEMGFVCPLVIGPTFIYRALDPNGNGVEHERDTILIGTAEKSTKIEPNPAEVAEYKWMKISDLLTDFEAKPDIYAPWLKIGLKKIHI